MLQQVLSDLKESGTNETKSTAGDKHETALAMLQIEQAQKREQLNIAVEQKAAVESINPSVASTAIVNGSLVKTDKCYFFISVALGKAIVDGITIIALSSQSPLGKQLMGLKANDTATINNTCYTIAGIE